jgi:uncharacterized protein
MHQIDEFCLFGAARAVRALNAEYSVGNGFVKPDQSNATSIGKLTRPHMSGGVNTFWVLLPIEH